MDALNNNNIILAHNNFFFLQGAGAALKIKDRYNGALMVYQLFNALVDAGNIQGINSFKIRAAIGQMGGTVHIQVKIIQGNYPRVAPPANKLAL